MEQPKRGPGRPKKGPPAPSLAKSVDQAWELLGRDDVPTVEKIVAAVFLGLDISHACRLLQLGPWDFDNPKVEELLVEHPDLFARIDAARAKRRALLLGSVAAAADGDAASARWLLASEDPEIYDASVRSAVHSRRLEREGREPTREERLDDFMAEQEEEEVARLLEEAAGN